jgi:hypothetical protein
MRIKKLAGISALLCALAILFALPAFAAESSCSLTLACSVGGDKVSGVVCSLYRVAEINGTTFTPTAAFKNAQIKLNGLTTDAQWQTAADSLAVYAAADGNKITLDRKESSDSGGKISFTGLPTGLYLAVFSVVSSGNTTYHFSSDLLALPQWDGSGTAHYDVTASPKGTTTQTSGGGGGSATTDVTVLKIWDDSGEQTKRPAAISVTLLCDGKTDDEKELTAENNWRYHWSGLPKNHNWSVLENNVPDGYTVSYTADGTILTITNQSTTNIPDTPTPGGNVPLGPTPGGNVTPGSPTSGQKVPKTPTPTSTSGKLPQTGQLWWPVPVLTFAGLLLFTAGWYRRHGNDHEA